MNRRHQFGALLASAAALGAAAAPASAQAPTTLEFRELDRGSTFKLIDAPPLQPRRGRAPVFSTGDQLVFTNPLAPSATTTAGRLQAWCMVTKGARRIRAVTVLCTGAYAFRNGTVYVTTLTRLTGRTTGAVTGGTGDYANRRGTFESVEVRGGSRTTITLAP